MAYPDDLQTVLFMLPNAIISEQNIFGEPSMRL